MVVDGKDDPDVLVRMAKCCTPVPGDEITGYISVGPWRHRPPHRLSRTCGRCCARPERFCVVEWSDAGSQSFRVEIAVAAWDRPRLLEDIARTFAEFGSNIVEYGGVVQDGMARNWYVVELGDVKALGRLLSALRNVEAIFDANRVTPRAASAV